MGKLVTFLSDFGLADSYVAEVKAVLLGGSPGVSIVDVSHDIPAYQISWGAFQLWRCYRFFPKGTIHLAVVDPGVGTSRRNVYVKSRDYQFVGPDNGVLFWAVRDCERREKKAAQVFDIPVPTGTAPTFFGRDVFAPFLSGLLKGKMEAKKGEVLSGREFPEPSREGNRWTGEVLGWDHFGNIVTSIPYRELLKAEGRIAGLREKIHEAPNYLAIDEGKVGLVRGSHGFWEISRRMGSAAELLRVKAGDVVTLIGS